MCGSSLVLFITTFVLTGPPTSMWKVKEWLQNLGIFDHTAVVHNDDESDVAADEQTTRNR